MAQLSEVYVRNREIIKIIKIYKTYKKMLHYVWINYQSLLLQFTQEHSASYSVILMTSCLNMWIKQHSITKSLIIVDGYVEYYNN